MSKIKVKIKGIADVKNGSTPSTANQDFFDGEIIWITPKDLSDQNQKYIFKGERTITEEGLKSCSSVLVPKGTILLSSRAPIGLLSIAGVELCTNQGFKNIVPNKEKIDSEFLYYYFKIRIKEIEALGSGTTFKEVSKNSIENYEIEIPEKLEDQQKIASVLSTLDAKIELNNKINIELEAMAKTLYDYWFVQFDFPNENGKPYKSNGGEMVWSEELKREIPKGWDVRRLKELLKKNNKKFNLNDEKHNIDTIDLSVMPSSTMCLTEKNTSDEFGTNLFEMNKFDILFGGIRPYLLKAGFAPFDGLVTGTVHSFNVINQHNYNFALLTMIHESMFQFAISNSKGTKMPVVGADDLLEYRLPYKEEVVKKFNQILSFKEIISKNIQENQTLASLRDFLLPMLMNGQVVVE